MTSKVSARTSYAWVRSRFRFRSSEDVTLLEFTSPVDREHMSTLSEVSLNLKPRKYRLRTSASLPKLPTTLWCIRAKVVGAYLARNITADWGCVWWGLLVVCQLSCLCRLSRICQLSCVYQLPRCLYSLNVLGCCAILYMLARERRVYRLHVLMKTHSWNTGGSEQLQSTLLVHSVHFSVPSFVVTPHT